MSFFLSCFCDPSFVGVDLHCPENTSQYKVNETQRKKVTKYFRSSSGQSSGFDILIAYFCFVHFSFSVLPH